MKTQEELETYLKEQTEKEIEYLIQSLLLSALPQDLAIDFRYVGIENNTIIIAYENSSKERDDLIKKEVGRILKIFNNLKTGK